MPRPSGNVPLRSILALALGLMALAVAYLRSEPVRSGTGGRSRPSAESRVDSGPAESSRSASRSSGRRTDERWSTTDPPINLTHIFEGEINRRGKPVGFHARPGGMNPGGARVVRILDGPNREGVYVARVEIRDPGSGRWLGKTSTLYPDALSEADVVAALLAAYR